jgi:glucose/arabinose dehydrogenase
MSRTSAARPRSRPTLETLESRVTPSALPAGFSETTVASGINAPTAMEFAPDGRLFVLEQAGNVRVITAAGSLLSTPALSLTVDSAGERGLLGIAFDPNFSSNHFVYLYYTVPGTTSHNRVSRFTVSGNTISSSSETVLLDLPNLSSATNHNGGSVHFGSDGKLYIGVGENANPPNSQSLSTPLGKLLRINPDGTIPTDNPFYNTTTGINRAIWALGLRNPFTFAVQPGTGRIFINDVGQSSFEEIDDGQAGANYGWPNAEGFGGAPTYTDPLVSYAHGSGTTRGFAITGGTFYDPTTNQFGGSFAGDYFYADLVNNWIRKYDPASGTDVLFASDINAATVDLDVDGAGRLYYLSRGSGSNTGTVERIADTAALTQAERFVQSVYQDVLQRFGTQAEIDGWANQLSGSSTSAIASAIISSHEAHLRLVDGMYFSLLGRIANGTEETGWVNELDQGMTQEQVAAQLLGSQEFAARANALEKTADANSNYVRALYDVLLRRSGNSGEVQGWVNQLSSLGNAGVAVGFLGSFEYRADTVGSFYGSDTPARLTFVPDLLKRTMPPSSAEVQGWANSSLGLDAIEAAFAGSQEYFGGA